jgi:hypothetical protein
MDRHLSRVLPALLALVLLAAACSGGGKKHGADGVTVHTYDVITQQPIAGIAVVVNDSAGAIVRERVTGDDGTVNVGRVPEGGSVTTYSSRGLQFTMNTAVSPPDGTTFEVPLFVNPAVTPTPSPATTLSVTLTNLPANAVIAHTNGPCNDGTSYIYGPTFQEDYSESCAPFEFLVVAKGTSGNLSWGQITGIAASPGNTVPVSVDVSETSFIDVSTSVTSLVDADVRLILAPYDASRGYLVGDDQSANGQSGTVTRTLRVPEGVTTRYLSAVGVNTTSTTSDLYWGRSRRMSTPPAATETVSATDFVQLTLNPPDVSDPARPSFSWITSLAPRGDFGRLITFWSTPGGSIVWIAYLPPDGNTSMKLPIAPATLAASFSPAGQVHDGAYMSYYEDPAIDDYASALEATGTATLGTGDGISYYAEASLIIP